MKRLLLAVAAGLGLALMGAPAYATETDAHAVKNSEKCPNASGWYTNPDEGDDVPTQKADGFLFEGKDLIHRSVTPQDLADVKAGSFVAVGTADKVVFKMETTAPYSTIVQTPDGKFWSSKVPAGKGSQSAPVAHVIDLTDADVVALPGKTYTGATKVVTFGVGYWTESGSTLVKSISFHGHTHALSCKPVASPSTSSSSPTTKPKQKCDAYVYTGTKLTLCDRFGDEANGPNCPVIKYRVTLATKGNDPWGLDDGGVVGIGCEGNPNKPTPSASHSSNPPVGTGVDSGASGGLPVTGPVTATIVTVGSAALIGGVFAVVATRRRRNKFVAN